MLQTELRFDETDLGLHDPELGFEETELRFEETEFRLEETELGFEKTELRFEETEPGFEEKELGFQVSELRFEQTRPGRVGTSLGPRKPTLVGGKRSSDSTERRLVRSKRRSVLTDRRSVWTKRSLVSRPGIPLDSPEAWHRRDKNPLRRREWQWTRCPLSSVLFHWNRKASLAPLWVEESPRRRPTRSTLRAEHGRRRRGGAHS